jgi:predicted Rossmann fold flavoprotein
MNCAEEYCREMQGLSLKNAELHIKRGRKEVYSGFGELMFTHFGITGPLVLTASADLADVIGNEQLTSWIDIKPAVSEEQLDARLLRLFEANANKAVKNVISELYPAKMTPVILMLSGIEPDTKIHDITKEQRAAIIKATKEFPITITALRGYEEAVVTKGGVSVREINPRTMESKKVPGLYFIGEVLDLDAYTGGFNLQIAWSTAAACAAELW